MGIDPGGVVQPFLGWVGNEGVGINWDASSVSSPVTVLSHRGEFKRKTLRTSALKSKGVFLGVVSYHFPGPQRNSGNGSDCSLV